jgi:recombination protein RecA
MIVAKKKRMSIPAVKAALEDLLKAHRLQADAPPLRGERRVSALPTGIAAVDQLTAGGFPRGQVSEVHGPASSGRTALALATVARALRAGSLAAWVDPADRFDPGSAAEAGVDLARLLWLRGRGGPLGPAVSATGTLLGAGLFDLVVLDLAGVPAAEPRRLPHTTWLRLQRAVENLPCALLLLAQDHVAHGPGGVSVALACRRGAWDGRGPGRLLTGLAVDARSGRRLDPVRFELQALA